VIGWHTKNRLFGWHYVHARNTATEIIRRVKRTADGERFIVYFGHDLAFIDRPDCGWSITDLTGDRPAFHIAAKIIDAPARRA